MPLTEPMAVNVYVSPYTGLQMFVSDEHDPCRGGKKYASAVMAEIQTSYWGRAKYRINVRYKISDADWCIHDYFNDVRRRMRLEPNPKAGQNAADREHEIATMPPEPKGVTKP